MRKTGLLTALVIMSASFCLGQAISGRVLDDKTGEPLAFATVYLENSTIGDITDSDGNFLLKEMPAGKYTLAASFVGYEVARKEVVLTEGEPLQTNIRMRQNTQMLEEVEVIYDLARRKQYLAQFKFSFLGATEFSPGVRILNEETLYFKEIENGQVFRAFAEEPIEVINKALGYKIYYNLVDFSFNKNNGVLRFFGSARFEELRKKTRKRTLKNRHAAYEGSLLQFFRWVRNPQRDSSYTVRAFERRLEGYDTIRTATNGYITINGRNAGKTPKLPDEPKIELKAVYKDTIGGTLEPVDYIFYNEEEQCFLRGGSYCIISRAEPLKGFKNEPISFLFISANNIRIFSNGGIDNPAAIYTERYWSWFENISTLLPMDYEPE